MVKHFLIWLYDRFYIAGGIFNVIRPHKIDKHFRKGAKAHLVLVPGYLGRWVDMYSIGEFLYNKGYSCVYVPALGWGVGEVRHLAKKLDEFLTGLNEEVLLISHSKGGLIGKLVMDELPSGKNIKGMISIATPYQGAVIADWFPTTSIQEVGKKSVLLKQLRANLETNRKIYSLAGEWDDTIGLPESCYLEGANNEVLSVSGHHLVLYSKKSMGRVHQLLEGHKLF